MKVARLIEELKHAEAPDRNLDDRIWKWVNEQKLNPAAPSWQYDLDDAPAYTSSLDAAISLVPRIQYAGEPEAQPMDYILERTNGGLTICARVGHNDPDRSAWGSNDAIALARAALEAHQEMQEEPHG